MSRPLQEIEQSLELEGYDPSSEDYRRQLIVRKVTKCQELHSVSKCEDCPAYMCSLVAEFLELKRSGTLPKSL